MKQVKKFISFILTSIFCFYGIGMISSCDNRRNESISSEVNTEVFDDFSLIIEVNKNSFARDEDIWVDISMMNNNSTELEISYFRLFYPYIPTATNYPTTPEMPIEISTRNLKVGESFMVRYNLGGCFGSGHHEIQYKAKFYLNYGKDDEQAIEILSNVINLDIISSNISIKCSKIYIPFDLGRDICTIVNNKTEFESVLGEDNTNYASSTIEKYDDAFFECNSLIFCYVQESGSNIVRAISSVYIESNTLSIYVNRYFKGNDVNDDITMFIALIEVEKEDILAITNQKVEFCNIVEE